MVTNIEDFILTTFYICSTVCFSILLQMKYLQSKIFLLALLCGNASINYSKITLFSCGTFIGYNFTTLLLELDLSSIVCNFGANRNMVPGYTYKLML